MNDAPAAGLKDQLLRFTAVGAAAFLVDAGVVEALTKLAAWNLYGARVVSYLAAATFAWWLNRRFTFGASDDPMHREWAKYLAANVAGGLVNYATYALLVFVSDGVRAWPWIGVAAGSLAGLVVNFAANKWYVFRRQGP